MGIWDTIKGWINEANPEPQPLPLPMTDEKNVLVMDAAKMDAARDNPREIIAAQSEKVATDKEKRAALAESDARARRVLESRKAAEADRQNLLKTRK